MKSTRIGIIGTGGMAHAHARKFKEIRGVQLAACCDIDPDRAKRFAEEFDIPVVFTDPARMMREVELDGVANVTPDATHAPIAIAAAKAGVPILSEKPLATSYAEGKRMVAAVRKAGIVNMVNFSYRDSSALQDAARRIARGDIGRILHVESSYLQSWLSSKVWGDWRTTPAWLWRLSTRHGSLGVLGDVGCHLYDATCLLAGPIAEIFCRLETYPKGVKGERVGEYRLDANDSLVSSVRFANQAIGAIHSSRWASGQKNSLRFRIFGDAGAVSVDLDQSWTEYQLCAGRDLDKAEWKTVRPKATPNNYQRFVRAIRTGEADPSDFANGLRVQAYLHYSIESAAKVR